MKGIKLKRGEWRKVEICWRDSMSYSSSWNKPKDFIASLKYEKNDHMCTRGFIFHQDRHFLYTAASADFQRGNVNSFGDVMKIPRECIIKITYDRKK